MERQTPGHRSRQTSPRPLDQPRRQSCEWLLNSNGSLAVNNIYGPYTNWTANGLAAGADNKMRALWNKSDGTAALWRVAPGDQTAGGGGLEVNLTFGPY